MPCGCNGGRPKEAMTAAAATAMLSSSPRYQVTRPDGTQEVMDLYVDAKTEARRTGGSVTEVR